jgi:hypothetical protein
VNYTDLQAAVADFLNRADAYAQIPTFIMLAEAKMNRRLRVQRMVVNTMAMIANEFETQPTDFLAPISMKLGSNNPPTVLDCIAPDAMAYRKYQWDATVGPPVAYSVVGTSFEFSPTPDQAYQTFLVYYAQVPALSASNLTNWLIAFAPDAYLYGALTQAALHLRDDRAGAWGPLFEAALNEIETADRGDSYGARLEPRPSLVI